MSAETLRRAAALMRERADEPVAQPERWPQIVALPLADWLDHEADAYEQHRASATTLELRIAPALAVANAYLGETS